MTYVPAVAAVWWTVAAAAGMGAVLDLRTVPVVLVTLQCGLLQGLSVAAAILSVRYLQGGAGVVLGAPGGPRGVLRRCCACRTR